MPVAKLHSGQLQQSVHTFGHLMTRTSKTHKQTPRWAQDSSAVKCLKWMLFNKVLQPLGYWNEDTFHTMNATVMFSREIVFLHLALRKWIGINPGVTLKWIIEQIQYSYSAMYYQVAITDKPPKILIQSLLLEKKKTGRLRRKNVYQVAAYCQSSHYTIC